MATSPQELRDETTGDLIRRLLNDVQTLLDRQVELVKLELHENLKEAAAAAKTLGIGAALLIVAGLCFFNFLFLGIDTLFPKWGWFAALICTLLFGIIGGVAANLGRKQVALKPLARTRETLKENAEWAKHQLAPNGRSSQSEMTSRPRSASSNGARGES